MSVLGHYRTKRTHIAMKTKSVNPLANLERRAKLAIKTTPAGRALDRQAARIERDLDAGKIKKPVARVLKQSLRIHREILVLKWIAAEMTTRSVALSKND